MFYEQAKGYFPTPFQLPLAAFDGFTVIESPPDCRGGIYDSLFHRRVSVPFDFYCQLAICLNETSKASDFVRHGFRSIFGGFIAYYAHGFILESVPVSFELFAGRNERGHILWRDVILVADK
jgi:hypothetical protein